MTQTHAPADVVLGEIFRAYQQADLRRGACAATAPGCCTVWVGEDVHRELLTSELVPVSGPGAGQLPRTLFGFGSLRVDECADPRYWRVAHPEGRTLYHGWLAG